jgi:hypothetical protein
MNQIDSFYQKKVERSFQLSCIVIDKIPNISKLKKKLLKKKARILCQEEIDRFIRQCEEEIANRQSKCKCEIYCFCVDENNKWIR